MFDSLPLFDAHPYNRSSSITLAVTRAAPLLDSNLRRADKWRGPAATETRRLTRGWPDTLARRKVAVGTGYASPIVVDDGVYVFSRRGTNEGMSAHDADTGRELWRFGYEAPFTMNSASAATTPDRSPHRFLQTAGCFDRHDGV